MSVVVETQPPGGTLYMSNGAYGGTDGTTMTRQGGVELTVTCQMAGHRPGHVRVVFDGARHRVVCAMERIKKCIPGVKNPFDRCQQAR